MRLLVIETTIKAEAVFTPSSIPVLVINKEDLYAARKLRYSDNCKLNSSLIALAKYMGIAT